MSGNLASDGLLRDIRKAATFGPDSGSRLAMDSLRLCDEFEIMRDMALRAEATIHEFVKQGEQMSEWISLSDKLPPVGQWVIVWIWIHNQTRIDQWLGNEWEIYVTGAITHWMPLPEAPHG